MQGRTSCAPVGGHKARPYKGYLHGMRDPKLATEWKRQERTRPWKTSHTPHEKDSRLRRLPISAATEQALCESHNGVMLSNCKGKRCHAFFLFGIESMTKPARINPAPNIAEPVSRSARRTTPRVAAVKGSASPRVTAVATGTASSPRAKSV